MSIDASEILAQHQQKYKSTQIDKEIPIENDLQLLAAFDTNPINEDELKSNRDDYQRQLARDSVQNLINDLFNQPITRTIDGPLAKLPDEGVFQLPREKPLPKPKPLTKWQKFANAKGIQHKRKDRMVFDEDTQQWVPRWGYGGINKKGEDQWLHEVKEGKDDDYNPAAAIKGARKQRTLKNIQQQLKNAGTTNSIQERQKADAAAKREQKSQQKADLEKSLHRSRVSTASMGKFDKKLEGEPKLKGQKRKFNPVTDTASEHKSNLEILSKVDGSKPIKSKSAGNSSKDLVNTRRAIKSAKN